MRAATNNGQTYFVTSNSAARLPLFRHERWADLFMETILSYRPTRFALHAFTVMPDHFHILITPNESLERAVQFIKGVFSFKAKKQLDWQGDVWVAGFSDHRIRDVRDCEVHLRYIERNAVKAGLAAEAAEYAYCSASGKFELDELPQGLKPGLVVGHGGGTKVPPFQNKTAGFAARHGDAAETSRFQYEDRDGGTRVPPFQSKTLNEER